jgi:3-isopropylmalate dehydrogenase
MNKSYRIALIPGDGVGPEVLTEAVRVLELVSHGQFDLELKEFDTGAARYLRGEEVLPEDTFKQMAACDAILLGALGDPKVPSGILERELLRLRQELDLYVNLRPARLLPGVPSPLAAADPDDIDMVFVRENTEGPYVLRDEPVTDATEISANTPGAVERIVRYAFELAYAIGRSLTLVHKTNVLVRAGGLYRSTFDEVAAEYPNVVTAYQHVDAAALLLVTDPRRFEVVVTDNLFGDILTDLAAGIAGGVGMAPSGNINPGKVSMFEPVHGSAPDIAGRGIANPVGAVMSAAMMLDHLGETEAGDRIRAAVDSTAGKIVVDELPTADATDLIIGALS